MRFAQNASDFVIVKIPGSYHCVIQRVSPRHEENLISSQ